MPAQAHVGVGFRPYDPDLASSAHLRTELGEWRCPPNLLRICNIVVSTYDDFVTGPGLSCMEEL
jgi:hypothetical protein